MQELQPVLSEDQINILSDVFDVIEEEKARLTAMSARGFGAGMAQNLDGQTLLVNQIQSGIMSRFGLTKRPEPLKPEMEIDPGMDGP
ncbi:MAG: hypothetical protein ABJN42_22550 [Roseibium sp.]|uniref:hypothetical protein n=1 Tax=Alphaproteobacteria TaxID=28211 RepID=UPI0032985CEF